MRLETHCPRCKRELRPWPLERGNRCSPARWAYCIRPGWAEAQPGRSEDGPTGEAAR